MPGMHPNHCRPAPLFHRIAALAAIVVCGLAAAGCSSVPNVPAPSVTAAAAPATVAPPPALRVEGVPPLPAASLAATQRYTAVAGHTLADWHPHERELLVLHRAPGSSTVQLFRQRGPQALLEPLTDGAEPVSSAQWEPRHGRYIVLSRGRGGDEAYQLHRLDPATRSTQQITPDGQRHALAGWLPSRGLALVSSVPLDRSRQAPGAPAGGGNATPPDLRTTLWLVDPLQPTAASRRTLTQLPGGGWFGAEVSPDESQLAITRYLSANLSEIWLVSLADGSRRQLLPAEGAPAAAAASFGSHFVSHWSADGRSLFFVSDRASEFRELMRLELATGAVQRLSATTPWDVQQTSLSADGRELAYTANVDGRDELRVIDAASGAARPLPPRPPGGVGRLLHHPQRPELAFGLSSTRGPAQVHTVNTATGEGGPWTQPTGTAGLPLQALPDQQVVRWKSFDGRTISGVLSLPPPRFAGRRPVVLLMHGGPEGQAKLGWLGRWNQLLDELGVAVLEPNVRGSTGYGKTFLALDNGRLREDSVRDMASAIDWIATQPGLDAERVLVAGGSYGGYMALAASTRLAGRIAGAASTVGISNFVSFLENTESYRRDLRRAEYGDERDPAMREFLTAISPLTHAAQITKPLLVAQGRNDPRVPWTESEQIVRSLQQRGTPVWYLLADNEGHGFARRENADFYFATLVEFIRHTLRP